MHVVSIFFVDKLVVVLHTYCMTTKTKTPIRQRTPKVGIQTRITEKDEAILESLAPDYLKGGGKTMARIGWAVHKLKELKAKGLLEEDGDIVGAAV